MKNLDNVTPKVENHCLFNTKETLTIVQWCDKVMLLYLLNNLWQRERE